VAAPGAYLHDTFVDTFAPQPRTSQPSIFTGDLRQLGRDEHRHRPDHALGRLQRRGRPLTLMLVSDEARPANFDDDWAAYIMGPSNVPAAGRGLESTPTPRRAVAETALRRAGWATIAFLRLEPARARLETCSSPDVAQDRFFYGDRRCSSSSRAGT